MTHSTKPQQEGVSDAQWAAGLRPSFVGKKRVRPRRAALRRALPLLIGDTKALAPKWPNKARYRTLVGFEEIAAGTSLPF